MLSCSCYHYACRKADTTRVGCGEEDSVPSHLYSWRLAPTVQSPHISSCDRQHPPLTTFQAPLGACRHSESQSTLSDPKMHTKDAKYNNLPTIMH